ncbi:MAG: ATP-binding protein [Planctomycetes bacterium]|nr:ATP-binding protein [Planctomycetota bacterium]
MNDDDILSALEAALEREPRAAPLWLLYGELAARAGRTDEALAALRTAHEDAACRERAARRIVPLLRAKGQLAEALIRIEALLAQSQSDGALHAEHARVLRARGADEEAARAAARARALGVDPEAEAVPAGRSADSAPKPDPVPPAPAAAASVNESTEPADWAQQFDWSGLVTTFADVAGLDDVKRQIRLKIIAPFQDPAVFRAFGRSGGGGILLYGPPGCGKTFIARAVAGECKARFVAVGIHEIVDKFWGESEKLVHALFEDARRRAPTVLFFDEFDALGGGRGRVESQFWKTLVDQLLQEMDGVQGKNEGVLLFAATNMPWNVDAAFRRPGRFDRVLFVPPPDESARLGILRARASKLPGGDKLDLAKVVKATPLFTGADLVALCDRAAERALEESLAGGKVQPVTTKDLLEAAKAMRSSAEEWLATARNHARYANESGQYDELAEFLKRHKRL